jgi:hypothetical protein
MHLNGKQLAHGARYDRALGLADSLSARYFTEALETKRKTSELLGQLLKRRNDSGVRALLEFSALNG